MKIKVEIDAPDVATVAATSFQAQVHIIKAIVPIVVSLKKSMDKISTATTALRDQLAQLAGLSIEDETQDEEEECEEEVDPEPASHVSWPRVDEGLDLSPAYPS